MNATDIKTTEELRQFLSKREELTHIHAAVIDNTGQMRGKTYSLEKFLKGLDSGIALTANLASADISDVIFLIDGLMGGDSSFCDSLVRPVPETLREIPWESPRRNLQILMEYVGDASTYACPRTLLKQQLQKAEEMGLTLTASFELEFRLYNESLEEAVEKGFRDLTPCPQRKQYLGVLRHQTNNDYINGLLDTMVDMGFNIETYHTELDPGLHELVMRYQPGMRAVDDCAYIQTYVKTYTQRFGRLASFMARPDDDEDGNGLHSHMSLQNLDGSSAFFDESRADNMSDTMRHFIGGQQRKLPELQLMLAPNVNSYRRFLPWQNAPIATTWGVDNRTVGFRVVGNDSPKAIRVENRLTGADANPYYLLAASLAAGLWGIENSIEPSEKMTGMSWEKEDQLQDWQKLHSTMDAAIAAFRSSQLAKDAFGAEFVRVFGENRHLQNEEFKEYLAESGQDEEKITDWELQRFLELS